MRVAMHAMLRSSFPALVLTLVSIGASAQPAPPPPSDPGSTPPPADPAAAPPADTRIPPPPPPPAAGTTDPPPPSGAGIGAQPPPPAPPAGAPPPEDAVAMGAGAETHDGFYLRLGLGFGGLNMERSGEVERASTSIDAGDSSIAGGAGVFELSIGGTPASGLVIAGTFLSHVIYEPVLMRDGAEDEDLGGPLNFVVIGGTLDWYPNPRSGFHFGGTLGIAGAVVKAPKSSAFENFGGGGGAISLLIGYDWWVGEEWSLGILGRFTGAGIQGEGEGTDPVSGNTVTGKENSSLGAFALMFSILHH